MVKFVLSQNGPWVSVVHVMVMNNMTASFRMKTHNGHQQVMVNT